VILAHVATKERKKMNQAEEEELSVEEEAEFEEEEENENDNNDEGYNQEYLDWRREFEKTHCKIINTATFIKSVYKQNKQRERVFHEYQFFTEAKLKTAYRNHRYTSIDANGNERQKSCITEWLNDANMKEREECDVIPEDKLESVYCPPTTFNTWKRSKYHGKDITPNSPDWQQDALLLYLDHMNMLCGYEKPAYDYLINWLAHYIQKPHIKSSHICICGDQGTGKSLAFNIYKEIVPGGAYETTSPETNVWGQYNSLLLNNTFIIISEAGQKNSKDAGGRIKGLITDTSLTINGKNQPQIAVNSFHRFVTLTNELDPIKFEEGDRRHVLIKCSNKKKNDKAYFDSLLALLVDDDFLLTLYSYLNALDIEDWKYEPDSRTPVHTHQRKMMIQSKGVVDQFLAWWVADKVKYNKATNGGFTAYHKHLAEDFARFKAENGIIYPNIAANSIGNELDKLSLPSESMMALNRDGNGYSRLFNIDKLKLHYMISDLIKEYDDDGNTVGSGYVNIGEDPNVHRSPPAAGGGGGMTEQETADAQRLASERTPEADDSLQLLLALVRSRCQDDEELAHALACVDNSRVNPESTRKLPRPDSFGSLHSQVSPKKKTRATPTEEIACQEDYGNENESVISAEPMSIDSRETESSKMDISLKSLADSIENDVSNNPPLCNRDFPAGFGQQEKDWRQMNEGLDERPAVKPKVSKAPTDYAISQLTPNSVSSGGEKISTNIESTPDTNVSTVTETQAVRPPLPTIRESPQLSVAGLEDLVENASNDEGKDGVLRYPLREIAILKEREKELAEGEKEDREEQDSSTNPSASTRSSNLELESADVLNLNHMYNNTAKPMVSKGAMGGNVDSSLTFLSARTTQSSGLDLDTLGNPSALAESSVLSERLLDYQNIQNIVEKKKELEEQENREREEKQEKMTPRERKEQENREREEKQEKMTPRERIRQREKEEEEEKREKVEQERREREEEMRIKMTEQMRIYMSG
jgi:hypothetical protein